MDSADRDLFNNIAAYTPQFLVEEIVRHPDMPQVRGQFLQGTLLLADISGFTTISEKLSELGREGAEELANIINRFFTHMLSIASCYRGNQLKFAGDATLILFLGPEHDARAVRCALKMQKAMMNFRRVHTSKGTFPIQMHIGINSGEFFEASLGSARGRLVRIFIGREVNQTTEIEAVAIAGEIFIGPSTLQNLGDKVDVGDEREGYYLVKGLHRSVKTEMPCDLVLDPVKSNIIIDALASYLPKHLEERIRANPQRTGIEGEHRRVTVLFVNLLGSSEIVEQYGKERISEIIRILNEYFLMAQATVDKYGGLFVGCDVSNNGDKLLVVFGAPVAHEDDDERAVLCGLELNQKLAGSGLPLQQRIGINSGYVYAGEMGSQSSKEYTVMGDEVNLAARIMGLSQDGQILVAHSTYSRTADKFVSQPYKLAQFKGKSLQIMTYEVKKSCEEGLHHRPISRRELVGRASEISGLKEIIQRVLAGREHFLAITGGAGMGKSRLMEELGSLWSSQGGTICRGNCQSYGANIPYLPWIELLSSFFNTQRSDSASKRAKKIESAINDLCPEMRDWAPVVGNLLDASIAETPLTNTLDPKLRHQQLLRTILELLVAQARRTPILLLLEDLHWADTASLELLNYMAANIHECPILFCTTYRPLEGLDLATGRQDNYTKLVLGELSHESGLELLKSILGIDEVPQELSQFTLSKSQGNPFYLEELVRSLVDAGHLSVDTENKQCRVVDDLSRVEVPDNIQGVIMSRVDQLDNALKETLRVSSVIGGLFQYELVKYIYPRPITDHDLKQKLDTLVNLGLILRESKRLTSEYSFKHILTQEVAYESTLFAWRRGLHHRVGEYFEEKHADQIEAYFELLCHHYSKANDKDKTLEYSFKSGNKAMRTFANKEAIGYYRMTLEAAARVRCSESVTSKVWENLGDIYELTAQYDQALESYQAGQRQYRILMKRIGQYGEGTSSGSTVQSIDSTEEINRQISTLYAKRGIVYERRGQYNTALQCVDKGLRRVDEDSLEKAHLCFSRAKVLHRLGRYTKALKWCQQALDIGRAIDDLDSVANCTNLLGAIHTDMGNNKQAAEYSLESLKIYEELNDLKGQAQIHTSIGVDYYVLGNWDRCIEHYRRGIEIAQKIGTINEMAICFLNLGEVLLSRGHLEDAIEALSKCMEIWRKTGYSLGVANVNNNLGTVYIKMGNYQKAIEYLEKSQQLFEKLQSTGYLPECYQHLAEAYCGAGQLEKALEYSERSLSLALELAMAAWEGEARRIMGQVYGCLGQWEEAKKSLVHSERILRRRGVPYGLGQTLWQLALLNYDIERTGVQSSLGTTVSSQLAEAVAIFNKLGIKYDTGRVAEIKAYYRLE